MHKPMPSSRTSDRNAAQTSTGDNIAEPLPAYRQAIRPHSHIRLAAKLRYLFKVGETIVVAKKRLLAVIPPLGDVVRIIRNNNTRHPDHLVTSM
jgi:hypothetical protein